MDRNLVKNFNIVVISVISGLAPSLNLYYGGQLIGGGLTRVRWNRLVCVRFFGSIKAHACFYAAMSEQQ